MQQVHIAQLAQQRQQWQPHDDGVIALDAVKKMHAAVQENGSPYGDVVSCLALILNHVWGEGGSLSDGSEAAYENGEAMPRGVDLLHAFPVADVRFGGCSGGGCGSGEPKDLVQLGITVSQEKE